MLDRVERTDVVNATALAGVLLLLGFAVLWMTGQLSATVDEGLFTAESSDIEPDLSLELEQLVIPSVDIVIRVGNGSEGRQGLAGRATDQVAALGYGTLDAVNKSGAPTDDSFVYYADSEHKLHAIQIAAQLNIDESQVRPLLGDPGVPTEGADIIVILGQNIDF